MGKRDRERKERIQAGEEEPIAQKPPPPDPSEVGSALSAIAAAVRVLSH